MATAKIEVTHTIVLTLSEKEAEFLKDLTQNSLTGVETDNMGTCRNSIFHALQDKLDAIDK